MIVLLAYLAIVFFIAWHFSRKESLESYFLNKRSTGLWLMTFSTVATVVGAGATVAVVSEVYNSGISYGIALPIAMVAGMVILGIMGKKIKEIGDEYDAHTIVDFFGKRFGKNNEILAGILQLVLLVIWVATQSVAIASLASVLIGINFQIALLLTAIFTIAYTAIGGLKIDIISDFIQFWIIFIMFTILAVVSYSHIGGIGSLISQLPQGHTDIFAFGGVTWFVGAILLSGFLFLGNTTHWQRIFSAVNPETARKSFYLAVPFILFLSLIILFIGLVASVTLSDIDKETALFVLMQKLLSPVVTGMGFAAVLAVIMSSVDSLLIAGSTIIHRALFRNSKNQDNKKELLRARIITAMFGVLGFLLAFLIPDIVTLSLLTTYLALIFIPPIFAGIYSQKISSKAVFYSLLIPTAVLFLLFDIVGENTFVITTISGIGIILFYDKIFKKNEEIIIGKI